MKTDGLEIRVEYCATWNYLPRALWMMGEIMADIQDDVRSVVLNPGSGGVFEWTVNGDLVFSKASTGRYPEMKELKELIYAKLDAWGCDMESTVRVLNPVGHVRVKEVQAALRPRSLANLRPGILENRKANARLLMETMVDRLRQRMPLGELTVGSKPVAAPPSRATLERLVANCDFVLVGSSD